MPDPTIGSLTPTDPAKVIAKAAEKLLVPAGSVMHDGFIELPPGSSPLDVRRMVRECHMRCLSSCQNEPHCTDAGECVLFLAIAARKGFVPVPPTDEAKVERVARAIDNAYSCRVCGAYCPNGVPPNDCGGRCSIDAATSEHRARAAIAAIENPSSLPRR